MPLVFIIGTRLENTDIQIAIDYDMNLKIYFYF